MATAAPALRTPTISSVFVTFVTAMIARNAQRTVKAYWPK